MMVKICRTDYTFLGQITFRAEIVQMRRCLFGIFFKVWHLSISRTFNDICYLQDPGKSMYIVSPQETISASIVRVLASSNMEARLLEGIERGARYPTISYRTCYKR